MEVLPEFLSVEPRVDEAAFIAPGAWVIGDVDIAEGASVWFGAVVRGMFSRSSSARAPTCRMG